MSMLNRRTGNLIGFLLCVGLMAYALFAQYVLGLQPCPLCSFQRVAVISLGLLFLAAGIHNPGRTGARVYGGLQIVAALGGIAVAARHIWIQAQPPGAVAACGADLGYMMEIMSFTEVVAKVLTGSGECGSIDWTFLGLSMPWWVAIALTALGVWAAVFNFRSAGRA